MRGGNRLLKAGGGSRTLLSHCICVSISALEQLECPRMYVNPVHSKARSCADAHSSHMPPSILPTRYTRLDQIACAEAKPALHPRNVPAWKAVLIRPAHPPRPVAFGHNHQHRSNRRPQSCRRTRAHAGRIPPVPLRPAYPRAVVLGAPARASFKRQAKR